MGEGEKLVRALFAIAREPQNQPAIIFIDEIDSLLSKRTSEEHEASRRLKTEFLVQFNAITEESSQDRVTVIGATNVPEMLDDAVIRRLSKRIYVGVPDAEARRDLILRLLKDARTSLSAAELERVVQATEGYSNSDLRFVCQDAAMGPVREMNPQKLVGLKKEQLGSIQYRHFVQALEHIRPSVSLEKLKEYEKWDNTMVGVNRRSRSSKKNAAPPGPASSQPQSQPQPQPQPQPQEPLEFEDVSPPPSPPLPSSEPPLPSSSPPRQRSTSASEPAQWQDMNAQSAGCAIS